VAVLEQTSAGILFHGTVDSDEDVALAVRLASDCIRYRADDEDEDPLGRVSCFACRYRRWAPDGFTCVKGALPAVP